MKSNQAHWIPLADMMTGLMMIFMLISVAYMLETKNVVAEFESAKESLQAQLVKEFALDLQQWNAEVLPDSTIRFKDPAVLFDKSSSSLKPSFKKILSSFIPRYIEIVSSSQNKDVIQEIRIEGHSSSCWNGCKTKECAYEKNMILSQERTIETLKFIFKTVNPKQRAYIIKTMTASGFSSSRLVKDQNGQIDENASQRVEFSIITNSARVVESLKGKVA